MQNTAVLRQCEERTRREEGRGDNVCGVSVTNYWTDPQPRDYFTQNTMAAEPAASPTVPVMAHLKIVSQVPMGEGGTRPHHMVFCVVGRNPLQESGAVKGRILSCWTN